ncbi:Tim17-domain-containing protein [Athelia psychrophila]|uniref:Tim17-domain-containing protein n=1 Tax=Athelia psychrophila TaxID=1759441 RepID=A0A166UZ41_9AGAM|nr:Tim17-domain-containing protein [Fibularhizoctonia sp. CBS 109695]
MPRADHQRDPCPWSVVSDAGSAFAMGAIGGGIWHGVKGAKNTPRGERMRGAISSIKARAPATGGNFGVFGALWSAFDCAVAEWRQTEDPWNAIVAGALTGGSLGLRSGPRLALASAVSSGLVIGVLEGAGVVARVFSERPSTPGKLQCFLISKLLLLTNTHLQAPTT